MCLSDGRLELDFGAGTVRAEFDAAGLQGRSASERIRQIEEALGEVRWRLADEGHFPRPGHDRSRSVSEPGPAT